MTRPVGTREMWSLIGDAVEIARQAPPEVLWCPWHSRELWFAEGPDAPKRCCDCQRLLVLRPEVDPVWGTRCACGHEHTSGRVGTCSKFTCDCRVWRSPTTQGGDRG